jgi:hypothetical protein
MSGSMKSLIGKDVAIQAENGVGDKELLFIGSIKSYKPSKGFKLQFCRPTGLTHTYFTLSEIHDGMDALDNLKEDKDICYDFVGKAMTFFDDERPRVESTNEDVKIEIPLGTIIADLTKVRGDEGFDMWSFGKIRCYNSETKKYFVEYNTHSMRGESKIMEVTPMDIYQGISDFHYIQTDPEFWWNSYGILVDSVF